MQLIKYLFIGLLIVTTQTLSGMEDEKQPIDARLTYKKISSLKTLAAQEVINHFNVNNTEDSSTLKVLCSNIQQLPIDIKKHLFKTILKKKCGILENILNAHHVEITKWDAHEIVITPDSKYAFMRARIKQSDNEPWRLIKVDLNTLVQEELISLDISQPDYISNQIIISSQGKDLVLSQCRENNNKFVVYLYNIETKKLKELISGDNLPRLYIKVPRPDVSFGADDSYVTVSHLDKIYVIDTVSTKLKCRPIDGSKAIPLDSTRILVADDKEAKVINVKNGKPLFTTPHTLYAVNPFTSKGFPAFDLQKQHLYTACNNILTIVDLTDGTLLKRIAFDYQISGVDATHKKLQISLKKSWNSHDTLEAVTDLDTYKIRAKNQRTYPAGNSNIVPRLSSDSLFYVNHASQLSTDISLCDNNGNIVHQYRKNHGFFDQQLNSDDSFIYASTPVDNPYGMPRNGMPRNTYIKLFTHRALTNNARLEDLLALMILEKQKRNGQDRDNELCNDLARSANTQLQQLADKRYSNTLRGNSLLSYWAFAKTLWKMDSYK